ncbi:MAG TPA: sigma-70 family RNA polymerase sigma factor [Candidatus Saccharimonadales bacterium]|nr:sigma-70 family RNA polymerase sigma factor [Candidatus Saccharimonadales bacterium]
MKVHIMIGVGEIIINVYEQDAQRNMDLQAATGSFATAMGGVVFNAGHERTALLGGQNNTATEAYKPGEDDLLERDPVRAYLSQLNEDILTKEQEAELAKRIEVGVLAGERLTQDSQLDARLQNDLLWLQCDGQRAKDHLIEANLRLVVSVAKRYIGRDIPFLDLIQAGNLGVIRAVYKFDYRKGYKFSTYATRWIRKFIQVSLAEYYELPSDVYDEIGSYYAARDKLGVLHDEDPTPEQIAKYMGSTPERLADLQTYNALPESLNQRLEGGSEVGDFVTTSTDEEVNNADVIRNSTLASADGHALAERAYFALEARMNTIVGRLVEEKVLTPRQAAAFKLCVGIGGAAYTVEEAAQTLKVSRPTIRKDIITARAALSSDPEMQALFADR